MSERIPAGLDAQLDALLDSADSADHATTDLDDALDTQAPLDDSADDGGDDDGAGDGAEDDGSLDAAASEGDDEGEEPAGSASASTEDDEWAGVSPAIRARIEQAERTAAELAAREEERLIAEQNARAEAQYNDWQRRLDEMDPEDRNAEIVKVLSEGYGSVLRQQAMEQQTRQAQAQFQEQHGATLTFVAGGHRVQPTGGRLPNGQPEYRRVDGASLPLTEQEQRVVARVTGGPLAMQAAADELVAMRRGQTAAARQALASKRREQNEAPTIGSGRQGAGPRRPEPPDLSGHRNVNDKLDALLDYQDQQYGGPLARATARR